ncbi:MAG: radical SAM protein [Deltaproteobacteria bacterium]|jgi:anaerobic ribonucleoside-triphosphate reductase activating protein|nr:radical SAM protein [Deltaproteobacteria bacterium]
MLNIGFIFAPVVVLGPGRRVGLWLKGCSRECPECISPELWPKEPSNYHDIEDIFVQILELAAKYDCNGVTISGGEPFEQLSSLKILLSRLQPVLSDILIYSGYSYLQWEEYYPDIKNISCLIDGAFEKDNPCDEGWKGSNNQKMIIYSQNFENIYNKWKESKKGSLQLARPVGRLIGIPHNKLIGTYNYLRIDNND